MHNGVNKKAVLTTMLMTSFISASNMSMINEVISIDQTAVTIVGTNEPLTE